ncbi:putative LRR receptor-like serine/threonine-protein kinase [Raphanus sativus]|nr:putative LRR receptor-like serine/threonine-protein kinase [Raphanus sativus]
MFQIPTSNSLQICLVKNGTTTPLISTVEIRPVGNDTYKTVSGSLNLLFPSYLNKSDTDIRYPSERYDRVWTSLFRNEWTQISTTLEVNNLYNVYVPPEAALTTAATPSNSNSPLIINWTSSNVDNQYYLYAHFAEIQELRTNDTREFNMTWNGQHGYVYTTHITQWVGFELTSGDIRTIMDPNLQGDYDSHSAWRVLELSMSCTNPSSTKRPSMSQVVVKLKECLENSRRNMRRGRMDSHSPAKVSMLIDTGMFPVAR